ncbi:unnamed protein product [Phyllotreta striolata]|uniref:Doublecortin domain-containing protein n=1 Tax=Phyllotreta striolata TaxID=444603 RepID=A0A9N9TCY7_PHYSR|nr:unnamed protein product [Phyllotreta striolata]
MKPKNKFKFEVLAEPEFGKTKKINTWINGESRCYPVTINPKDFRSWPPILTHVTNVVQPNFGLVKKLVALSTMRSVNSFEELDPNEKYVALGASCKIKEPPGGYETVPQDKVKQKRSYKKCFYVGDLNPKSRPFLQVMQKKKLTVVYIAISGKTRPPQKVIFNEQDMKDWNLIRNYLAKLLGIAEGVQNICSIYGDVLDDASQFQQGYLYVVVPFTEQFVRMDYASFSKEKNNYRRNFMLPVLPPFNSNSFARAPGLEKQATLKVIEREKPKLPKPIKEETTSAVPSEMEDILPTLDPNVLLSGDATIEKLNRKTLKEDYSKHFAKESLASIFSQYSKKNSECVPQAVEKKETMIVEGSNECRQKNAEELVANNTISKTHEDTNWNVKQYEYLWKDLRSILIALKTEIERNRTNLCS